jgi:predicted secreted protein
VERFGRQDRRISTKVGRKFALDLDAMGTAGYTWRVSHLPPHLALRGESIRPASPGVGGSSRQELVFEVLGPGSEPLVLTYGQPWESKAEETVEITVEATA